MPKKQKLRSLKAAIKMKSKLPARHFRKRNSRFLGIDYLILNQLLIILMKKIQKKTLRDFLESNEIAFIKLKHKSEPNYNQVIVYRNFLSDRNRF